MNINATQDDLHSAAEALKLAAILDDRAPKADKARIAAWAVQIHRHELVRDDVLDGLQIFYDSPSDRAIGIGDLIHYAKMARRARIEHEDEREREARRQRHDTKVDDRAADVAITAAALEPSRHRTPRLAAAEEGLQSCYGKQEAVAAITEYHAARKEARKGRAA